VITFVDVTERRHVEQALRESERMLRQEKRLVELSRDPIFIWDFNGEVLEWNRGSEELYGYGREEAVGQKKDKLLATAVPGSSFAELRAKLLAAGSWNGELRHKTKDGRELTVEARIVLETIDGRQLALESTRDITERKAWEQQQQLLLGELTHRVKNTLAVVQAIAHQTRRSSVSSDDFIDRFDGRLSALASAHSLLIDSEWQGADLEKLIRKQLDPYASGTPTPIQLSGDPVSVPADLATPLGLVLHELATNAAKHGSLSLPAGSVKVTWTQETRNNQRFLTLLWRETGGPPVQRPPKTIGFGSTLIEKGIPNATVTREFHPGGLVCAVEMLHPDGLNLPSK